MAAVDKELDLTIQCAQCLNEINVLDASICKCSAIGFCNKICYDAHPHSSVRDVIHNFDINNIAVSFRNLVGRGKNIDIMNAFIAIILSDPATWDFSAVQEAFASNVSSRVRSTFRTQFGNFTKGLAKLAANPDGPDTLSGPSRTLIAIWQKENVKNREAIQVGWSAFTGAVNSYLRDPTNQANSDRLNHMAYSVGTVLNGGKWVP